MHSKPSLKLYITLGLLVVILFVVALVGHIAFTLVALPLALLAYFVYSRSMNCPACGEAICNDDIFNPYTFFLLFYIPSRCSQCGEELLWG